jgi:urea transporter
MLGVSAMAVQNALVQVSLKGAPSTAVMTTNVTRFTSPFIGVPWLLVVSRVLLTRSPATRAGW